MFVSLFVPSPSEHRAGPFTNLVDFFEVLQHLPSKKHSRAVKLHADFLEVYGSIVLSVKQRIDAGEAVPHCLAKTLLEGQQQEKLDWEDVCMLSAAFALGGVHSVRTFAAPHTTYSQEFASLPDFGNHPMVPCSHRQTP